jgi:class 3 adenylate cyclase/tetratricopeptide (TPR) repeat protein
MMDIAAWLKDLGFEAFTDVFEENGIDASFLPELTNEDLKDLGVVRLADRKRLLKAIGQLFPDAGSNRRPEELQADLGQPALSGGERRQVTVLFADLTNFTSLSNELGAEAMHGLLNRYFTALDEIVIGYGGSIDKHIGDNVMAVFGAPMAHHNDPERAVRAARDMHVSVQELSRAIDRDLQAHIGIASGQVIAGGTGSDAYREYTVTGETVNLASRLQDLASGGDTFLSDDVVRSTMAVADYASVGEVDVKGFPHPLKVWRLEKLRNTARAEYRSPFVDRATERRLFSGLFADCLETRSGQSILIRGEAGIGKSRLIRELETMALALDFRCHKAQVHDFGLRQDHDSMAAFILSLLSIPADSSMEDAISLVDSWVANNSIDANQHACLNDLLGHPQPVALRSLFDAMDGAARTGGKQAFLTRLLTMVCDQHPVMVCIEDIHWASTQTLELVAHIASTVTDIPLLLVMTSRIVGDPLDQRWRTSLHGKTITTLDLGSLPLDDAKTVAGAFPECDEIKVQACIERAGGNPLFLEQLLLDAGQSVAQEVPGSIQSLVQARMDRLGSEDKDALQAASVIGVQTPLEIIRYILDKPFYDVDRLAEHFLLNRNGEDCYFSHALIRDSVYAALLRDRKQLLHARAAAWFKGRDAILYAQHLDRAEAPEAATAYQAAARQEAKAYRFDHALELADQGLRVAVSSEDRFRLDLLRGDLLRELARPGDAIEVFRSLTSKEAEKIDLCRAWIGIASCVRILGGYKEGFEALTQAEPMADGPATRGELSDIAYYQGCLQFAAGQVDECLRHHQRSCDTAREAGDAEREARALSGLGDAYYGKGAMKTALSVFQACHEICQEHGFGRIDVGSGHMKGVIRRYLNEFEAAIEDMENAVSMAIAVGNTRTELIASIILGEFLTDHCEAEPAYAALDRALSIANSLGNERYRTYALYEKGLALWHDPDRRGEAESLIDDALTVCRTIEMSFLGPRVLAAKALLVSDARKRRALLHEAEAVIASGCNAHNGLWFYRHAAEACLNFSDWDEADRYALALETYPQAETLPWASFFASRARILAAFGRGARDETTHFELRRLREEAEAIGLKSVLPSLQIAEAEF